MKKGDLLVPVTDEAKSLWGTGIVTTPNILKAPIAHLVFWLSHKRELAIEEELLVNFNVIETAYDLDDISSSE